jgi:metal-responsive CopG/Arc/MetJ family transcriptional regulator
MGRTIKINITLPRDELEKVDAFARSEGASRSGLIRQALDFLMEEKEKAKREEERRKRMAKTAADIRKLSEKSGDWNGVAEIRKWRDMR